MNENYYKEMHKEEANKMEARIPKADFIKQLNEKRNMVFKMSEEEAYKVSQNPKEYLQYLELLGKLDYTVTNTLLVHAQKPNASLLKDNKRWSEAGNYIRKGEKGILILEPKEEYTKRDGSIGINYAVKSVFDISQVHNQKNMNDVHVGTDKLISALVYQSPIPLQEVENLNSDEKVLYNSKDNTIYYETGLSATVLVQQLMKAYCTYEYQQQYGGEIHNHQFFIDSATYTLASRYNVEMNNTDFVQSAQELFDGMNHGEIKKEFSHIKELSDRVSERMDRGLYKEEKQISKKEYTR